MKTLWHGRSQGHRGSLGLLWLPLLVLAALVGGVFTSASPTPSGPPSHLVGQLTTAQFPGTFATYQPAELWGGGAPADTCFVCNSVTADGVGSAATSVDPDNDINPATGDFSTTNTLFSAPAVGQDLELQLSYSSQEAQTQQANHQSYSGAYGWGWGTNYNIAESNSNGNVTVTQPNGAQITFSLPGYQDSCPLGDYEDPQKYTLPFSTQPYCAPQRTDAQLGLQNTGNYEFVDNGEKNAYWLSGVTGQMFYEGDNTWSQDEHVTTSVAPGSVWNCPNLFNISSCIIVTDQNGRQVSQGVTAVGMVSLVVDPHGNWYEPGFNSYNQLTSVLNSTHNSVWKYSYQGTTPAIYAENLVTITDPNNQSTSIGYNPNYGQAWSETDAAGARTNYVYENSSCTNGCVAQGDSEVTSVAYPDGETDIDHYFEGILTSSSFGSANSGDANFETWTYNYTFPSASNQDGDTVETIVHPGASQGTATTVVTTDSVGNVLSTQDANGQTTHSMYNDTGANDFDELCWSARPGISIPANVTCSSPPAGSTSYTYDSDGNKISMTDPLGNTTRYGYYLSGTFPGRLCWTAPPTVTSSGSACLGSSPSGAAPTGATAYEYDANGNLTANITDWNESTSLTSFSGGYDSLGFVGWTIPPAGQSGGNVSTNPYATNYTYYGWGPLDTTTAPDSGVVTDAYDADANLVSVTGPLNEAASYGYDPDERRCWSVLAANQSGTCANPPNYATVTTFLPGTEAPSTIKDPNGNTTTYSYADPAYPTSPTKVADPMNNEVTYTAYDAYGNPCVSGPVQPAFDTVSQCNPITGDTAKSYDSAGDVLASWDANGNKTTYTYDYTKNNGYDDLVTSSTNPRNQTTGYAYDNDGRLITTAEPNGNYVSVGYDADSRECSQAPVNATLGCGVSAPTGLGATAFSYNDASELTSMQDNNGVTGAPPPTTYTYTNGQMTSVTETNTTDNDAHTVSYLYGYGGEVLCIAYPTGTPSCGSITSRATPSASNAIVNYGYDTALRATSVTAWTTGAIGYSYNDSYNPTSVTGITFPTTSAESVAYVYDKVGNLTSATYKGPVLNKVADTFNYNTDEQVQTASILGGTTTPSVSYNSEKQITSYENPGQSGADTYNVNQNGEILSDTSPAGTTNYSYNADGSICWKVTGGSQLTNPCSGSAPSGATTYSYDADGQRTGSTNGTTSVSYGWNAFGQMCWSAATTASNESCSSAPTGATQYGYAGNGLRMTTTTSGSTSDFTWDPVRGGTIPLDISNGSNYFIYGPLLFGGTAPIEQIGSSSTSFLSSVQSGVQDVFSSAGTELERATYSLYGTQNIVAGSNVTPFGFQGSYTDGTGLIYLIDRYYDPATAQFLSIDPDVAETGQPYAYTADDPLNATDPLGLMSVKAALKYLANHKAVVKYLTKQRTSALSLWVHAGTIIPKNTAHMPAWGAMVWTAAHHTELEAGADVVGTAITLGGATWAESSMDAAADSAASSGTDSGTTAMSQMERTGSGLKDDMYHRATSWVVDDPGATATDIVGADGLSRSLYTLPGELNGASGVFEWIVDNNGESPVITHQFFNGG